MSNELNYHDHEAVADKLMEQCRGMTVPDRIEFRKKLVKVLEETYWARLDAVEGYHGSTLCRV